MNQNPAKEALISITYSGILEIEWSVHLAPKNLKKTFEQLFRGQNIDDLLIIPTWQKTTNDMSSYSDKVEDERDQKSSKVTILLKVYNFQFIAFSRLLCEEIISTGHWADFIDPTSGLPVSIIVHLSPLKFLGERSNSVYMETEWYQRGESGEKITK